MNTSKYRWWRNATILMAAIACTDATDPAAGPAAPTSALSVLRTLSTISVNGLTIFLQQRPDFPGAASSDAYGINNAGDIVGGAIVAPTMNTR